MTKTELLNRTASDEKERLVLSRVLDKMELTRQRSIPSHTSFLSPAERAGTEALLNACGHPPHLFFGGFEGAERTICVFFPEWQTPDDWIADADFPVRALRATYPKGSKLSHRDFLGSVLGLGLDRDKTGDFLVKDGSCDILVLDEISDFIRMNLEQAGRVRLKITPIELSEVELPPVQVRTIRDTVAAMRLDAVASSGFSLARGKMADAISSGKVQLNYRPCMKTDRTVSEGDVISCRGLGKCVVKEIGGPSKKGRIMLVLERYI